MELKLQRLYLNRNGGRLAPLDAAEPKLTLRQIVEDNGDRVITVSPTACVSDVLEILELENVGALIVSRNGKKIDGIISERDIVRGLRCYGEEVLERNVDDLMRVDTVTCDIGNSIDDAMAIMMNNQARYLPVLNNGELAGFVSICDLVSTRVGRARSMSHFMQGQTRVLLPSKVLSLTLPPMAVSEILFADTAKKLVE